MTDEAQLSQQPPDDHSIIPQHTEKHFGSLVGVLAIAILFHICSFYTPNTRILIVLTHIGLCVFVAHRLRKANSIWQAAAILGGLSGAVVAGIVSIYTLIVWFNFLAIFKLITQTVFTGVLDSLGTGLLFILLQLIQSKISKKTYESSNQTN